MSRVQSSTGVLAITPPPPTHTPKRGWPGREGGEGTAPALTCPGICRQRSAPQSGCCWARGSSTSAPGKGHTLGSTRG